VCRAVRGTPKRRDNNQEKVDSRWNREPKPEIVQLTQVKVGRVGEGQARVACYAATVQRKPSRHVRTEQVEGIGKSR